MLFHVKVRTGVPEVLGNYSDKRKSFLLAAPELPLLPLPFHNQDYYTPNEKTSQYSAYSPSPKNKPAGHVQLILDSSLAGLSDLPESIFYYNSQSLDGAI